ncbi:hypothetical protein [Sulfuriferula plumbiphila]|uniref:hypothetical protein n=1 Tax=Sulfuriferula plumbiphila TaxID=171865 RepID=UPI0011BD8612|nr:hypothetical protein [Sulfuriferula plumbiphila]
MKKLKSRKVATFATVLFSHWHDVQRGKTANRIGYILSLKKQVNHVKHGGKTGRQNPSTSPGLISAFIVFPVLSVTVVSSVF